MDRPIKVAADKAQPSKKSPTGFFDLPAELRNDIYRLAFCTDQKQRGYRYYIPMSTLYDSLRPNIQPSLRPTWPTSIRPPQAPGFLATCRQVHAEASSILYGENAFAMRPPPLLDTISWYPSFISRLQILRLSFNRHETSAFLCPVGTNGNPDDIAQNLEGFEALPKMLALGWFVPDLPDIARTLEALETVPKLRILSIRCEIRLKYGEDPKDAVQIIAQKLRPVIRPIMERVQLKVRDVLKLDFEVGLPIRKLQFRERHEQLRKLIELSYEELEAGLE